MANKSEEEKKKYDLDKITEDMDPDQINEKVELPHIKAHSKWGRLGKISVSDYPEFRKEITEYMQHHHKEIYNTDMPDEIAFTRARDILANAFSEQTGGDRDKAFQFAYQRARKGRLGDIIRALAAGEESMHRRSYTQHIFQQIDPLDFDAHVDLVNQYKSKYGSFLPKELKQKSSEELAKDYTSLIEHHTNIVEGAKGKLEKYVTKKKEAA